MSDPEPAGPASAPDLALAVATVVGLSHRCALADRVAKSM